MPISSTEHPQQAMDVFMGSNEKSSNSSQGSDSPKGKSDDPDWAAGLKQLYDAVVEEDLPDAFKDLLAQLDDAPPECGAGPDDGSPA
ncbi:MAG: NepR family anti-sigma factor [Pseudomonadota bacterium]